MPKPSFSKNLLATSDFSTPVSETVRLYPHKNDTSSKRDDFSRDRDRIVHSRAFRRLQYKTQVFVYHINDHFRNRLTHSLEVAQIARSIAKQLKVKEELSEAIALAHDIGHPPFGHIGERTLNQLMESFGGFEHNTQSFIMLTKTEKEYIQFDGLNLTRATINGIVKHNGIKQLQSKDNLFYKTIEKSKYRDFIDKNTQASFEAQIAAISDDISYNTHDIDDGVTAELFSCQDMIECGIKIIEKCQQEVENIIKNKKIDQKIKNRQIIRNLINKLICDVIYNTKEYIKKNNLKSYYDIIHHNMISVRFSDETEKQIKKIKQFLKENMYQHKNVVKYNAKAEYTIKTLFNHYLGNNKNNEDKAREICNKIARMTDRYADEKVKELFLSKL